MKKLFIGCFNKSVILTYIGIASAVCGIGFVLMDSEYTPMDFTVLAMIMLMISGLCDLFDGYVARKCERNETQKAFGIQLDSLADMLSFVALPLTIYLMDSQFEFSFLIAIAYAISAVNRLAWYNVSGNDVEFRGMPVTMVALILPIARAISVSFYYDFIDVIYVILSLLFSLNFKFPKPKSKYYFVFIVIFVVVFVKFLVG